MSGFKNALKISSSKKKAAGIKGQAKPMSPAMPPKAMPCK